MPVHLIFGPSALVHAPVGPGVRALYDGAKYDVVTPIDFTDGTVAPLRSEHAYTKWIGRLVRRKMLVTKTRRGVRSEALEPGVGEVMSFNERTHLFRVKYNDRMQEHIDWQELEPIIIHDKELGDGCDLRLPLHRFHRRGRTRQEHTGKSRHDGVRIRKLYTITSQMCKVSFSEEVTVMNATAEGDSITSQARKLRSEPIQALEDDTSTKGNIDNIVRDDHPKNFKEVIQHPECENILESGRIEMKQMYDEGEFEYPTEAEFKELLESGRPIMNLKMVYVRKFESKKLQDGSIVDVFKKWKGRLALQGTREMLGIDASWSSFSLTIGMTAIRTFMALSARENLDVLLYDLSGAFFGTPLKRPVFAKLPKESGEHAGKIVRCVKAIYGLKSSSRDFVKALGEKILEFEREGVRIRRVPMDHCIYQFRND